MNPERPQPGRPHRATTDLREDLQALDQRLQALQRQVAEYADPGAREPVATPPSATAAPGASPPPPMGAPLTNPGPQPPSVAGPGAGDVPPARPAPGPAADEEQRAARARAAGIIDDAHAQVAELKDQIQRLIELRDYLHGTAEEVMARFSAVLDLSAATRHPAPAPIPGEPPPVAGPEPDQVTPAAFAGPVIVEAGPFDTTRDLGAFEQLLRGIPSTETVRLDGLDGGTASFALQLSGSVLLETEIARRAPYTVTVHRRSAERLVLHFPGVPGDV